jgi:tRNA threonylcarbamoyl adenosine modification protein YjeE
LTHITLKLKNEADTARLGADLALVLKPGDRLLLEGDLGTGKTTLARAFIRAANADFALDVPSPTFTLTQIYDGRLPVVHADLYRLASPEEVDELALDELADDHVILAEWPDRASQQFTTGALLLSLKTSGPGREAVLSGPAEIMKRVHRTRAIRQFLVEAGLATSDRAFFFGDASARAFETVTPGCHEPVSILMNAPAMPDGPPIRDGLPYSKLAHLAENVTPFVAIAGALTARGLAAPVIHAADHDAGLLLVSNLGGEGVLDRAGRPIGERYVAASECLAELHAKPWPARIPDGRGGDYVVPTYDRRAMLIETRLLIDWYWPRMTGLEVNDKIRAQWAAIWNRVLDRLDDGEKGLVLRDFHSPNIIWRAEQTGVQHVGLIDFQDAVLGPTAYDVASLGMDARVTVPPALETDVKQAYCANRRRQGRFDEQGFERDYAIMAAQRNAKILGIFIRLDQRDGKPAYLRHLPRVEGYFQRAITHPSLAELAEFVAEAGLFKPKVMT